MVPSFVNSLVGEAGTNRSFGSQDQMIITVHLVCWTFSFRVCQSGAKLRNSVACVWGVAVVVHLTGYLCN
jgi:hypothetical protein